MQTAQLNLREIIGADGQINVTSGPLLRELVDRYPFFHAARMLMLRLLYQQRDPQFNEELRKAALFLPSRARIYEVIEGDSMRPKASDEKVMTGATHERKSKAPLDLKGSRRQDRTGALIDSFLQTTPPVVMDVRSGRPVDATTDYINYWLQEEASREESARKEAGAEHEGTANSMGAGVDAGMPATPGQSLIDDFISSQGDKRIRLSDKHDSELQKPALGDADSAGQQGAFTETLARIYIKQGKFEHAIEIIRRLSLKYPKKNRYFADQIRFLEKLILNNQAK